MERLTYVSLFDNAGVTYGTATCEVCGPISARLPLDTDEPALRQAAAEHWIDPS